MNQKHTDIIPIGYLGGSGGHFLGSFLTKAKYNYPDKINLSNHGNSHNNYKEMSMPDEFVKVSAEEQIKIIKEIQPNTLRGYTLQTPYFFACHIIDADLLVNNFEKVIYIHYEYEDIYEIAKAYYGKWMLDEQNVQVENPKSTAIAIFALISDMKNKLKVVKDRKDLEPNVCNISWKELVHAEPNILIDKLSKFIGIDSSRFSESDLNLWRTATIACIDKYRSLGLQ